MDSQRIQFDEKRIERIAILETQMFTVCQKLDKVLEKLDNQQQLSTKLENLEHNFEHCQKDKNNYLDKRTAVVLTIVISFVTIINATLIPISQYFGMGG